MLIGIPTNGGTGLDDTICEHFGSAPYFCIYNDENGETKIVENRNAHHSHGTCHPMSQLAKYNIDGIVCVGMGRRAVQALNAEGIRIYRAQGSRVKDVIEQVKAGNLMEMTAAEACHGHGHTTLGADVRPAGQGRGACCGRREGHGHDSD